MESLQINSKSALLQEEETGHPVSTMTTKVPGRRLHTWARLELTHSLKGGHVRSVDESGLIDDTTHVLERKQRAAKSVVAGARNAGKGIHASEGSN